MKKLIILMLGCLITLNVYGTSEYRTKRLGGGSRPLKSVSDRKAEAKGEKVITVDKGSMIYTPQEIKAFRERLEERIAYHKQELAKLEIQKIKLEKLAKLNGVQ